MDVKTRTCCAACSILVLSAAMLAGCQQTPRGSTGGRIDPYRTTAADEYSRSANMPSMLEYSERVAQSVAKDLASIEQIDTSSGKKILELGDLNNQTRTPTSDFELIQRRIRSQLLASDVVRNRFVIVEERQRMDRQQQRITGAAGGTATYNPEDTYILQGDFLEANRGSTRRYYFNFKLVNLASREIVFNEDYDLAQQ